MDSIKQYNLAGVASEVELGKRGAKIDGTRGDKVALKKRDGSLINAEIADGTESTHAVTKAQLNEAASGKLSDIDIVVDINDNVVDIGTFGAGTTVLSVTVSKGAGNWVDATSDTEITVGVTGNNSLLFSGFTPDVQCIEERNVELSSDTNIKAYVNSGGATAGTAKIRILYAGTFTPAE